MHRLARALALLCGIATASPALAAGSIPIALQSNVDVNGRPLAGCLLYMFQVGTVAAPQNMFSDFGLTLVLPNPLQCDQFGRVPMFYLADGAVHVRLTDASGVQVFDYPSMQVLGPSSGGGGGGGSVDPTTVASTGDFKWRATSETLTGWVKSNGQSIGSATSGATGRANADTQNLFVYLWTNCVDAHCPVSSGRGATALADFSANKTIGTPDLRARALVGLDDMGNSASSRMVTATNITSGGGDTVTTPMATGGECCHQFTQAELPNITLTTTIASGQGAHTHTGGQAGSQNGTVTGAANNGWLGSAISTGSSTLPSMTGTTPTGGSGAAGNRMGLFALGTWHIKL